MYSPSASAARQQRARARGQGRTGVQAQDLALACDRGQLRAEAPAREDLADVRRNAQPTGRPRFIFGGLLQDGDAVAGARERERAREPADARADDEEVDGEVRAREDRHDGVL
jgi:hypothetical protein